MLKQLYLNKLSKLRLLNALLICVLFTLGSQLYAAGPLGKWKTIDDNSGKAKSIIELKQNNMGEITGTIIKVLYVDDGSNPETKKCDQCSGTRKNQPVNGMTILWGVKKDGDEWSGGEILDPKTGSIYNVKFYLDETGNKLNVRGYIGFSLLGRTQVWHRM